MARGLPRVLAAQSRPPEALPGGYMTANSSAATAVADVDQGVILARVEIAVPPERVFARSRPTSSRSGGARPRLSNDDVLDRPARRWHVAERRHRRRRQLVSRRGRGGRGRSAAPPRPDLAAVVGARARRRRSSTRSMRSTAARASRSDTSGSRVPRRAKATAWAGSACSAGSAATSRRTNGGRTCAGCSRRVRAS